MKKTFFILFILLVVIVVAVKFFSPGPDEEENTATRISSSVVRRGDLVVSVSATGVIEPILTVDLKSKASGEIIEFPIEEGDRVSAGQLVCRLDDTIAANDYRQVPSDLEVAKISLSQARKQAERQNELYQEALISELDHEAALLAREEANSNLVRAKANLDDAREQLDDTVIESPPDGIVLKKYFDKGHIIASGISAVSGGTVIATIADMSRVYVRASIDEVDIGQISIGQKATVIAESYPDREFTGQVLRIHPLAKVEQNVTTFDVTIEVDNSDDLLLAGMNAGIEIIAGHRKNTLLVPREALTDARSIARIMGGPPEDMSHNRRMAPPSDRMSGGSGAPGHGSRPDGNRENANPIRMVIQLRGGEPEPKRVEIGLSSFEEAEILSGVSEGDTVLTTVTSKALQDREEFVERIRSWNQLPGMEKKKK